MVDGGLCLTGNLGEQHASRGTRGGQSFVRAVLQREREGKESHRQLMRNMSLGAKAKRSPITIGSELSKIKTHRNQSFTRCL